MRQGVGWHATRKDTWAGQVVAAVRWAACRGAVSDACQQWRQDDGDGGTKGPSKHERGGVSSAPSPRMMTEVVPSPTSSSCVLLSSMMDCMAQQCLVMHDGGGRGRGRHGKRGAHLGRRVGHIYLSEDGVAIICQNDACMAAGACQCGTQPGSGMHVLPRQRAHTSAGVQEHLQHGTGSKCGAHDVSNSLHASVGVRRWLIWRIPEAGSRKKVQK